MALTIIDQPPLYTGAFSNNMIKADTDDNTISQLKYELEVDGNVLGEQFIPVYGVYNNGTITNIQSNIDVRGLYMSMVSSYDNPVSISSNFEEINASSHQQKIKDVITEYDDPVGDYIEIDRYVFKSVDVKWGTEWDGSKNYIPLQRDKNNKIIRKAFNGMKIPVSFYTQNTGITYSIDLENNGSSVFLGTTSLPNQYRLATFVLNTTKINNKIKVGLSNTDIDIIVDFNTYKNKKVLYFLNRWGGWDWFCANHYETREIVNKSQYSKYESVDNDLSVMQLIDGSVIEQRLYGSLMNNEAYEYLKDMVKSPIVLDENGERIRVIDNNFRYDFRDLVEAQFTIQYIKKENINY